MRITIRLSDLLFYTRGWKWDYRYMLLPNGIQLGSISKLKKHLLGTTSHDSIGKYFSCKFTNTDFYAYGVSLSSGFKDEFERDIITHIIYVCKGEKELPIEWGNNVLDHLRPQHNKVFKVSIKDIDSTLPIILKNETLDLIVDVPEEHIRLTPFQIIENDLVSKNSQIRFLGIFIFGIVLIIIARLLFRLSIITR